MSRTEITTQDIVETIQAVGLSHYDFKCEYAANRINDFIRLGHEPNVWEEIAEMARFDRNGSVDKAWALAGVANPYEDEAAA